MGVADSFLEVAPKVGIFGKWFAHQQAPEASGVRLAGVPETVGVGGKDAPGSSRSSRQER